MQKFGESYISDKYIENEFALIFYRRLKQLIYNELSIIIVVFLAILKGLFEVISYIIIFCFYFRIFHLFFTIEQQKERKNGVCNSQSL